MDSTGLSVSLEEVSLRLDHAIHLFQTHPSHDVAIRSALEFCVRLPSVLAPYGLIGIQNLATTGERVLTELARDPDQLSSQGCFVVFSIFEELREQLVAVHATGQDVRPIPQELFDAVEQLFHPTAETEDEVVAASEASAESPQDVVPFRTPLDHEHSHTLSERSGSSPGISTSDAEQLSQSWSEIAPQADQFALAFFERLAASPFRKILANTVDEDVQRQFAQAVAICVRFANEPDRLQAFSQQIGGRTGLRELPKYQRQAVSQMFVDAIGQFLSGTSDETLDAWERLLECVSQFALMKPTDPPVELRKAG